LLIFVVAFRLLTFVGSCPQMPPSWFFGFLIRPELRGNPVRFTATPELPPQL
jgi:hypothetical protein